MIFEVITANPIAVIGLILSALGIGYGIFSDLDASNDAYQSMLKKLNHDYVFDTALYKLQKKSLKQFHDFNTRDNVIATNLALGKQSVALSKARIGTSGTFSPAYYAAIYEADKKQTSLNLQFLDEVSKISIYEKSARLAYENNIQDNYAGLVATNRGAIVSGALDLGSEIIDTIGDIQKINRNSSG